MRRMILAGSLLLGLSSTVMAAQVYKWVDAQGITHFGAQPPEGQETKAISTTVAPPPKGNEAAAPASPALPKAVENDPEQKAIDEKVKKEVAVQEAERKKYCENTRTNLAQLQNNPRVREAVNGEVRKLTEEERQQRIVEMQKGINENCL